jgi:hypothetical protein
MDFEEQGTPTCTLRSHVGVLTLPSIISLKPIKSLIISSLQNVIEQYVAETNKASQ